MNDKIKNTIELLAEPLSAPSAPVLPADVDRLPSVDGLREFMELVREVIFPGFFDESRIDADMTSYFIGVRVERLFSLLKKQICYAFGMYEPASCPKGHSAQAGAIASDFVAALPELRRLLLTDVDAMFINDPAARDRSEVIYCYPALTGMLHYRVANTLLRMGVPLLPRIITEMAHSATGIDIHPGATIGSHFSIDHGTGVVIGETCRIGHHVRIYQGVTLGAKNFVLDDNGQPVNIPRHPIIGDYVTIYSNATVLGRITVGEHAIIGGNLWVTFDVPPHAKLLQRRPVETSFSDGLGI